MAKQIVEVGVNLQVMGTDTVGEAAEKTKAIKQQIIELKEVLKTLPKDSEAFNTITKSIQGLSAKLGTTEIPVKNLKTQLREMKALLASGTLDNDAFNKLAKEAGELEDRIADVNDRVKNLGSDSKNLEGLIGITEGIVGGFAALQGITALVGDENEDLNKTLVKLQGAIAVLNGLEAVNKALQKEKSAALFIANIQTKALAVSETLLAFATGGATAAMNVFRTALLATGIGAVIVLIVAAVSALQSFAKEAEEAAEAQERLNKSIERETEYLEFDIKISKQRAEQRIKIREEEGASIEELTQMRAQALQTEVNLIQQQINENNKSVATASKNSELKLRQEALVNQGILLGYEMRKKLREKEEEEIRNQIASVNTYNNALVSLAELQGASEARVTALKKQANVEQISLLQEIVDSETTSAEQRKKAINEIYALEIDNILLVERLSKSARDKRKQREDQERQERREHYKQLAKDTLDAYNNLQDQLDQARLNDEDYELLQLTKKYEAEKSILEEGLVETNELTELYLQNRIAIRQKYANEERAELEANFDEMMKDLEVSQKKELQDWNNINNAKVQIATDTTESLLALGELLSGQNFKYTAAGKIIALAQIATDTALAISALSKNSEANPANSVTSGVAGALQFAAGFARITSAAIKAKSVLNGAAPSASSQSGGSGSGNGSQPPSKTFLADRPEIEGLARQQVKVVVLEKDISEVQARVAKIKQQSILE